MIQNTNYGASKTYVNTKVDKLTTSGLKAYTHDGATQGETDVSNTYTPSTLALRDSNGRLIAADPANGATNKTLVTANWVSQTGDSGPNNLVHKNGNESIYNLKTFYDRITVTRSGIVQGYVHINDQLHQAAPYEVSDRISYMQYLGKDSKSIANIEIYVKNSGNRGIRLTLYDKNNAYHYKTLFEIDENGNQII